MKFTKKGKRIALVGLVVLAFNIAGAGLNVAVSYPTQRHIEIARQLAGGPEENNAPAEATFDLLMATPEANWTVYASFAVMIVEFLLFIAAIYLTYRYLRQNRLTSNAGGITTGYFVIGSVIATLISTWLKEVPLRVQQPITYDSPGMFLAITIPSLIATFLFTFLIVLVVERIYNRKHSFAIE